MFTFGGMLERTRRGYRHQDLVVNASCLCFVPLKQLRGLHHTTTVGSAYMHSATAGLENDHVQ